VIIVLNRGKRMMSSLVGWPAYPADPVSSFLPVDVQSGQYQQRDCVKSRPGEWKPGRQTSYALAVLFKRR
jgi:hypothetical protein